MIQIFNYYQQAEIPALTLCNPEKVELLPLPLAQSIKNTLKYNALSELTFNYPQSGDGGKTIDPAYTLMEGKMVVLVEDVGYYIIQTNPETLTGSVPTKAVSCLSLENELISRRVTNFTGTYAFADLLQKVLDLIPTWTIGTIDASLLLLYRTFGEGSTTSNNQTAYNFLMTTVEKAYGCVFLFDTFSRTVSAVTNAIPTVADTSIFLSFDNLIKTVKYNPITEEICTALHCYGGGNLDIHYVNPLGSSVMFNFSYFETPTWMSQGLINTLHTWEALVAGGQAAYANLLTSGLNYNNAVNQNLADLNTLYDTLGSDKSVRSVRLQQQLDTTEIDGQITTVNGQITTKSADLSTQRANLDGVLVQLREAVHTCLFTTKISYDNFKSDVTTSKDSLNTIFETWHATYNRDTFYPDFNSGNLSMNSPQIVTYVNTAIAQNQIILNALTTGYATYPPTGGEISTLSGYIDDIKTTLGNLHDLLQTIIPFTDIIFEIKDIYVMFDAYSSIISYPTNMTTAQYLELCSYIYENTYTNNNIIMTDIMTPTEIQAQAQYLYDQSLGVLAKTCAPRYEFSGEFSNFIVLPEFSAFTTELELGKVITVKKGDNSFLYPVLLEISITYDNPTEFSLTSKQSTNPLSNSLTVRFGNSLRIDDESFVYGDILGKAAQLASDLDVTTPAAAIPKGLTFKEYAATLNTKTYTWVIDSPMVGGIPGPRLNTDCTLVRIDGYCVGGTSVSFNINERSSIGVAGENTMATDLVATPAGAGETSFIHSLLSAGNWLWMDISNVTTIATVTGLVITFMVVV